MDAMRRSTRLAGRRSGFSLIEMLFVVILLGIVAGYAFPVVERGVAQQKADRAAQAISNDLRSAFVLAGRQHKPVRITINATNRSLSIADRATGTVLAQRNFGMRSAFALSSMTTTKTTIDVFPTGIASDTLRIRFGVGTNSRLVRMTRVGHVQVQ